MRADIRQRLGQQVHDMFHCISRQACHGQRLSTHKAVYVTVRKNRRGVSAPEILNDTLVITEAINLNTYHLISGCGD